ncbi:MAG TPA: SH3 domain-containing protein, partial [Chloroflexota bacterium]|nr:SH3 domain-containing protein [Chloroflexota bacterium]
HGKWQKHHPSNGQQHATATVQGLHVRAQPSMTGQIIGRLNYGQRVRVLQKKPGWYKVKTNSLKGWSSAQFLKLDHANANKANRHHNHGKGSTTSDPKGTVTVTAHLRSAPSLLAHIIQWVNAGSRVTILHRGGQWDHVRLGRKKSGYVWSQFVR